MAISRNQFVKMERRSRNLTSAYVEKFWVQELQDYIYISTLFIIPGQRKL